MNAEVLLLAAVNTGRPTGIAAVYALLGTEKPRRVLPVFIAVGFTWSVLIGVLVVSALHGVKVHLGQSTVDAVVSLGLGSAAVGFAVGIASGRVEARASRRSPTHESRIVRALRSPSLKVVAGAGVLTHLPGVLYLLGLNAISATDPHLVHGVLDVLVFDAIWFAVPIAAFVVALRRPDLARRVIDRANAWTGRHERQIAVVVFGVSGAYFAIRGAVDLL